MIDLDDLLDQRSLGINARIGGMGPGGVRQQDQLVGVDEVRNKSRDPIVVAPPNLVVGNRIVSFTIGTTPNSSSLTRVWPRGDTANAR